MILAHYFLRKMEDSQGQLPLERYLLGKGAQKVNERRIEDQSSLLSVILDKSLRFDEKYFLEGFCNRHGRCKILTEYQLPGCKINVFEYSSLYKRTPEENYHSNPAFVRIIFTGNMEKQEAATFTDKFRTGLRKLSTRKTCKID